MNAFGIPPSRPIGDIKTAIKDAILDGKIQNDREQAWGLMVEEGARLGLALRPGFERSAQ
jgi:poly(A) polymerase